RVSAHVCEFIVGSSPSSGSDVALDVKSRIGSNSPRVDLHRETSRVRREPWQEWQGAAFVRVRSRSLARSEHWKQAVLSERTRAGANIARICHAEGRGFESLHPLVYPAKRHLSVSLRTTDDLLHAPREMGSALGRTRTVEPSTFRRHFDDGSDATRTRDLSA